MAKLQLKILIMFLLFWTMALLPLSLFAQNFMSPAKTGALSNQNALGFGYYNAPIVYQYKDASKEKFLSNYSGWLLKYVRYFGATSALQVHYLQAHGEDDIRELSGSLLYGFNLNGRGLGAYVGVSYSLKQRTQFAGLPRLSSEKERGWDYPIGVHVQNGLLTFSIETRYKYFVLQGDNVKADSIRYPLYFSVLMNF